MSNVLRYLILVVLIGGTASQASCQKYDEAKQRSENILLSRATSAGANFPALEYYLSGSYSLVSLDRIVPIALAALNFESSEQRIVAAEILYEKTKLEYRDQILESISWVQERGAAHYGNLYVRAAILRWRLGEMQGRKDLLKIASDPYTEIWSGGWVCRFIHLSPVKEAGTCPVCNEELEKALRPPNATEWEAKILALRILQSEGETIGNFARAIVASDAEAQFRMQAAAIWANEEPEFALPHLEVFLHAKPDPNITEPSGQNVELLLFGYDPKKYRPMILRLAESGEVNAVELLYSAGNLNVLEPYRTIVTKRDSESRRMSDAIYLLGKLGQHGDIDLLEPLLETKFKIHAAEAILSILSRYESGEDKVNFNY